MSELVKVCVTSLYKTKDGSKMIDLGDILYIGYTSLAMWLSSWRINRAMSTSSTGSTRSTSCNTHKQDLAQVCEMGNHLSIKAGRRLGTDILPHLLSPFSQFQLPFPALGPPWPVKCCGSLGSGVPAGSSHILWDHVLSVAQQYSTLLSWDSVALRES